VNEYGMLEVPEITVINAIARRCSGVRPSCYKLWIIVATGRHRKENGFGWNRIIAVKPFRA
jgi:hypothetical protein